MRFPRIPVNPPQGGAARDDLRASIVSQLLPPDPKAPTRPTAPPPTCGTLPAWPLAKPDVLGGSRRK